MKNVLRDTRVLKVISTVGMASFIGLGCYLGSKDWKLAVFIGTVFAINELGVNIYHSYLRKSKVVETSSSILTSKNKYEELGAKIFPSLSSQINNNNLWLKLSILISLALFLRVTISKRVLPIAFCLDYLLIELHRYLGRVYIRLFHSNSVILELLLKNSVECSKNWSDRKIITIALFFDVIRFVIFYCMFIITIGIIPACTSRELRTYYEDMKNSEMKTSSLKYKIFNRIKTVVENYPNYLVGLWCIFVFYAQSLI